MRKAVRLPQPEVSKGTSEEAEGLCNISTLSEVELLSMISASIILSPLSVLVGTCSARVLSSASCCACCSNIGKPLCIEQPVQLESCGWGLTFDAAFLVLQACLSETGDNCRRKSRLQKRLLCLQCTYSPQCLRLMETKENGRSMLHRGQQDVVELENGGSPLPK